MPGVAATGRRNHPAHPPRRAVPSSRSHRRPRRRRSVGTRGGRTFRAVFTPSFSPHPFSRIFRPRHPAAVEGPTTARQSPPVRRGLRATSGAPNGSPPWRSRLTGRGCFRWRAAPWDARCVARRRGLRSRLAAPAGARTLSPRVSHHLDQPIASVRALPFSSTSLRSSLRDWVATRRPATAGCFGGAIGRIRCSTSSAAVIA